MTRPLRIVIAGGGTGGHLFPGVAIAEELRERDPEAEILFVGTERGIEARVLPDLGWKLELISVSGLKTVGLLGAIKGALRIPGAIWQSRRLLKGFAPDVVIGVGGYASGPVVLAGRLMGKATAILEQNSIPGLTNRILGKLVRRVFLSFEHSRSFFRAKKTALIGNPIRKQILSALQSQGEAAPHPFRLFVFGGSQGAMAVNALVADAAGILHERGVDFEIVHQCGSKDLDATRERYEKAGVKADCRAFIDDMAAEYQAADLIVARAGATTIAELGIVGKAAILVPYPFAANNHQELNAQEMVDAGAALMFRQSESDASRFADAIGELIEHPDRRQAMGAAMRALGAPRAAAQVIDWAVAAQK